ncbi:MerR family transcriptional regulator [candidate division KSB1 bacterium]|nr:MerR family transcriptional regulator [candidate division KSB1 bacterium]NIR70410.1 MerR family transcriptional regulator [candidate division KSB1 bacterium]NIS25950.1 MerR family transcriptional regulator [candidate division KSB1 bacterium]NIT69973.1 MerR family transcriptional regulator [candidate division KSB1 bacterium]NIU26638.1 MerR family transcriptional regulator [candidate division KSB1 bacterium]
MKNLGIKKLYYSISEVSEMTSLKPYVLRYWESEFSELRPSKNRAGNRIYRKNDIDLILLIKKLLYTEKYTIEGAKQKLNELNNKPQNVQLNLSFHDGKNNENFIEEFKSELKDILRILDE